MELFVASIPHVDINEYGAVWYSCMAVWYSCGAMWYSCGAVWYSYGAVWCSCRAVRLYGGAVCTAVGRCVL